MAKTKTQYVCQKCGRIAAKEMGKCPQCGVWNSMVEEVVTTSKNSGIRSRTNLNLNSQPTRLSEIEGDPEARLHLPIEEFARVLGGGIVPGSVVLIGGDPGIGKSTLMLQVAATMAREAGPVLYVSGEESTRQIKMRALRLDASAEADDLYLVAETDLAAILAHIENLQARLVIVDSIQTTYNGELTSAAGSVSQVRECAARLTALAKSSGLAMFLVGHVTKEGNLAGPRVLEHMVDTVLYLEGDRHHAYRLLRGVKNRFGAISEVGVFEMREAGMVEVANPSEAFLAERLVNAPGSAIAVTMEGTRPLLVEVQALASTTAFGNPRRTPNGVDFNRLLLTSAVLTRRLGVRLADQDVFVNVIGGLQVQEPAADLAIAMAIASSVKDRAIAADLVLIGEIGLSGELRAVGQLPARLHEASKLGFRRAIIPKMLRGGDALPNELEVTQIRSAREALKFALVAT